MRHLPRRLLGGQAEKRTRKQSGIGPRKNARVEADSDSSEDEFEGAASAATGAGQWSRRDPGLVSSRVPTFVKPVLSPEDSAKLENLSTAYDYYKLFQSDSFVNEVVYQSRLYAVQKGYQKSLELVSRDTYRYEKWFIMSNAALTLYLKFLYLINSNFLPNQMCNCRCTEAMLLHSGYHTVPRRKMLWEMKPDCRNELVADSIRRDQVDAILQCLHFRDNSKLDDDGYFKVKLSDFFLIQCINVPICTIMQNMPFPSVL